jgi:hypothetical protein
MSIGDAQKFIRTCLVDAELRDSLNQAPDHEARTALLGKRDLRFSQAEFEEGHRNLLVECQHEANADELKDLSQWWQFLQCV